MSRWLFLPALAVCAAGLFSVSTAAAQTKAGAVNLQKAILDTGEIKKAQNDMQAKYKKQQDDLDRAQKELNDIQTQLNASNGRLSAAGEADLQARGQRKQREVQRLTEDLQAAFEHDRQEILGRAQTRMIEIVSKVAEAKGLDVVVEAGALVYIKPTIDITAEVIAAYDKAYPAK